jgi:ribosomal protein S18 acetylase RimI-like enzyme
VDDRPANLALAELTIWEGLRAYATAPNVRLIENASVRAVLGPVPYEGFNALFLSTPGEIAGLTESLSAAERAEVPMLAHLWLGPGDLEPQLPDLSSAGFHFYEEEPAMVAPLESGISLALPSGLSIAPVRSEGDLASWAAVLTGSTEPSLIDEVARLRNALTAEDEPAFGHLLGTVEGQVIACAAVFAGSEGAEVQHVVTDVRFRRRGIGTSMTVAAMEAARRLGYSRAVLTASTDGAEIYRRLGFRTCGTVRRYLRLPNR